MVRPGSPADTVHRVLRLAFFPAFANACGRDRATLGQQNVEPRRRKRSTTTSAWSREMRHLWFVYVRRPLREGIAQGLTVVRRKRKADETSLRNGHGQLDYSSRHAATLLANRRVSRTESEYVGSERAVEHELMWRRRGASGPTTGPRNLGRLATGAWTRTNHVGPCRMKKLLTTTIRTVSTTMPSFLNRLKAALASQPAPAPAPAPAPTSSPSLIERLEAARAAEELAQVAVQDRVGLSKTGMLHKAFESRSGEDRFLADCNLETALHDVRAAAPEDVDVKRCGRCYPSVAKSTAPRRRTLARRSPQLVYLVSPQPETGAVIVKAWFADENGRMDRARGVIAKAEVAEVTSEGMPAGDRWLTSKETERIYMFHEDIREGIFQLDDAIREAIKG